MAITNRNLFFFLLSFTFFKAEAQDTPKPTPQWRPVYHFTPEKNWTNDPNGLIYLDGKYQLYYQHNPFENKWGHMSWGHAESTDLIHWKHLPVAIPEMMSNDTIVSIFSGSAVLDKNNTSGLGKNGKGPIVAIYTGDLPKQKLESQYIAYSNDNGLTYTQYKGNPVIDLNRPDFRDPNVFWFEPKKKWIMAIAMVVEHQVRFYESANLKDWVKLSDFGPAGDLHGWECPALIPLPVDGNPNNIKYVLLVSYFNQGLKMQYFIGDFDGTSFTNSNPAETILRVDYGDAFYAAIPWHDAPQDKKILLGWLVNGKPETYPWKGQMSIPRDLSLRTTPNGIRLFQEPTSIITNALGKTVGKKVKTKKQVKVKGSTTLPRTGNASWIEAEIFPGQSVKAGFWVAANNDGSKKVEIGYNAEKQELYVDCTLTESANKEPVHLYKSAPVTLNDGALKLQVLLDKSSLEVFANNGESVITTMIYPDQDATSLFAFASGSAVIKNLTIWDMNP